MTQPVILVCPCCASTVDAWAQSEPQEFTCLHCGQKWLMVVDTERQARFALS